MVRVLVLSSSAHTDRVILHTDFLNVFRDRARVRVWATSVANPRFRKCWDGAPAQVEPFPSLRPFREFPYNDLRRINEFAWDFRLQNPSRLSSLRHIREKSMGWRLQAFKHLGRVLASLRGHRWLEGKLERMMIGYNRSPEAQERLLTARPDVVVSTGTFRYEEPAVVAVAKQLGIPVLAYITSWDNISVKGRMVLQYDGYLVWSQRMKEELLEHYPLARGVPVYVVGAPQFDVFFQPHRRLSREEFCRRLGLHPERPLVVHALGVANGVEEHHAALDLAQRIVRGELGNAQLVVRPHPFQNHLELRDTFRPFGPSVVVQQYGDPNEKRHLRSQDDEEVTLWVNTFRHADVVVHLSSTCAIDAAVFDRPSVCLDYDPAPERSRQALVRDVNHRWTHYKPVAESGGMWLAADPDQLVEGIRSYLRRPELHREERRRMADYVCGLLDGRCGERLAQAVLDFSSQRVSHDAPVPATPVLVS